MLCAKYTLNLVSGVRIAGNTSGSVAVGYGPYIQTLVKIVKSGRLD